MATVELDVSYYMDELSTSELRSEMNRRIAKGDWPAEPMADDIEPWTRAGMAADLRMAFYARDASRLEMLLSILETKESDR